MLKFINILVFAITIAAYLSTSVSPEKYWIAGFLSLSIPILLLLNVLLLVYFLLRKQLSFFVPLVALLIGYRFLIASFAINFNNTTDDAYDFSLLSYNVRVFNTYAHLQKDSSENLAMVNWVANNDADIKCLQEYYNEDQSKIYNTYSRISHSKNYHAYLKPALVNEIGAQFGLAIFSKFPIISKGEVRLSDSKRRFAIYADLLLEQDTLRVYNVHLQSMSIDEKKIGELDKAKENYMQIAKKLQLGFIARAREADFLAEHVSRSPYRTIVCGDFNDMPYSYTYLKLKQLLRNAFEDAGHGLNFSYNGKLFFLRIDNQFYSDGLTVHAFNTYHDISYSDHFPLKAYYSLNK